MSTIFTYKNQSFKIDLPTTENDTFIITSECSWIDKANIFCMLRKPSLKQIQEYIIKQIDSTSCSYTDRTLLQSFVATSVSPISAQNATRLFSKDVVANVIINEYMDCGRWLKTENNIDIQLTDNNIFVWEFTLYNLKNKKLYMARNSGINVKLC